MLIWDYIRDFLVMYIFGGISSTGEWYMGHIGYVSNKTGTGEIVNTSVLSLPLKDISVDGESLSSFGFDGYITLGDWLSTTTTIIIMCAIVFCFALLVRWIFKTVTSAFLLK